MQNKATNLQAKSQAGNVDSVVLADTALDKTHIINVDRRVVFVLGRARVPRVLK